MTKNTTPIHNEANLELGPYKRILLLGGGQFLRSLCIWAPLNKYSISVITSPRHAAEMLNNETLETFLKARNISYLVADKMETSEIKDFIFDINT